MSHAEKCPICLGTGKLRDYNEDKSCHGCDGKGWVTVEDKEEVKSTFVVN